MKKVQAGYKVQPLSAFPEAAGAAGRAGDRFPEDDKETVEDELLRVSRLRCCSSCRRRRKSEELRREARDIGIGPGKTSISTTVAGAQGRGRQSG